MSPKVPGTFETPKVAPFESCVGCFKGDTTTGFAIEGEAEWLIAGIARGAGIPLDQSQQMVLDLARDQYGCEPGSVPAERMQAFITLCRECASKTGTTVIERSELAKGAVRAYRQPETDES